MPRSWEAPRLMHPQQRRHSDRATAEVSGNMAQVQGCLIACCASLTPLIDLWEGNMLIHFYSFFKKFQAVRTDTKNVGAFLD